MQTCVSIPSCSAKRLFTATLLCSSYAFPFLPLHSLVSSQFLCKLIGPLVHEVTPPHLKHTSPGRSCSPQLTHPCVYGSAFQPEAAVLSIPDIWVLFLLLSSETAALFIPPPQESEGEAGAGKRHILGDVLETQNSNTSNYTDQGSRKPWRFPLVYNILQPAFGPSS